jgi:glycosyltransferase involved in cell wall biosynthesis
MRKKHILVIAQYFYPEQFRINDICEEWIKRGYEVTVITGIPNYPQGKFYKGYGVLKKRQEKYKEINIIRIPIVPRGHNSLTLILNYFSFVISGFLWKVLTRIKADYVFIYEVSPMTQALPGVWYAKRRKIPCFLYVTDLWPENVEYATGIHNKLIISLIQTMVDYIYRSSDMIFTSSKRFIDAIKIRGVTEDKVKFWPQYAEDFYKPLTYTNLQGIMKEDIFKIIFAGNIGYAQGLEVLPKAAAILKEQNHHVKIIIVGDGRAKDNLIRQIDELKVYDYFCFIDKKPPQMIPELVSVCDVNLICLSKSKVFEITLPAKTQSCLACGKPILVCADGEIQEVINDAKAGLCSNASDEKMLADKIIQFTKFDKETMSRMSKNAIEYSNKYFNKKSLLDIMDEYFCGFYKS